MIPGLLACSIGLLPLVTAQSESSSSFWVPNFSRLRWAASAIADETKLIVDGGELIQTTTESIHLPMASTIIIDLTVPWTNLSVKPTFIDKPISFPCAIKPYVWFDSANDILYTIGGAPFRNYVYRRWHVGAQKAVSQLPYSQKLWQISHFPGPWSVSMDQPPKPLHSLAFGNAIATESSFFALGGIKWTNGTTGDPILNPVTPGLVKYNYLTSTWSNMSASGYGHEGAAALGQAVYTPLFGSHGVIIYIGGFTPSQPMLEFHLPDGLQDMSQIRIYDIASGTFTSQSTTGLKPAPRWGHCVVSATEAGSGTIEIFVSGGTGAGETSQPRTEDFTFIYVLSLPSFVWMKVPGSKASQRFLSTCQVIGNRQMAIVGGDDPTATIFGGTRDPWENGIGIFDISMLRWSSSYDPDAEKYKRADIISELTSSKPYPRSWDSNEARKLFAQGGLASTGKSKTAPLVGGVVGGIIGLAIIAFMGILLWRRRRNKEKLRQHGVVTEGLEAKTLFPHELRGDDQKPELGPPQPWEIGTSGVADRFELDAGDGNNRHEK